LSKLLILGVLLALIPYVYLISGRPPSNPSANRPQELKITLKKAYQGVKDGNVDGVPLPVDRSYITVEVCIENLSSSDYIIPREAVLMTTKGHVDLYPSAVGYDEAEAFDWLLTIAKPLGAKRIPHKFYFFLPQRDQLISLPAYQSQGCSTSSKFKSLAFLFLVPKDIAGQPHTLHFFEEQIRFTARRPISPSGYVAIGVGLGILVIGIVVIMTQKRKSREKAAASQEQNESQSPTE
jgi:hypothetical protein